MIPSVLAQFLIFHSEIQCDGAWWLTLTDVMATFRARLQLPPSFQVCSPHPSNGDELIVCMNSYYT